MDYKNILFTKSAGIGKLVINRPPVNVMDIATLQEMNSVIDASRKDPEVKVLMVTGAGNKAFSAGVEVRDHLGDKMPVMVETFDRLFKLLLDLDKPTIAVVNGMALGGGCEVAIACDMVIASEKAQFGQPEIKLGVLAPVGAVFFARIFGLRKGLELILSGDSVDAREAERFGLVNKVVADADLEKTATEFAQRFTEKSGTALRWARKCIYRTANLNLREALEVATEMGGGSMMTEDAQEGLNAYLEKRKPTWKNK